MKWEKQTKAVYSARSDIVKVSKLDVALLKQNVTTTDDKRIRICTHQQDALLHEMIIVISKGSYIRPHKHIDKSESFHMIEGEMDVLIFGDGGDVIEIIPMGTLDSGKNFFYRLSAPRFHSVFVRSEFVVFHETTNGPFRKEDTVMAPWSPASEALEQVDWFLSQLEAKLLWKKSTR